MSTLRCPDHDVELEQRPFGDVVNALRCPAESDSMMSTANRWCQDCGARGASWMSGTCAACYRANAKTQEEQQRDWADQRSARLAINAAMEEASDSGATEVAEWLGAYKETLP